MLSEGTPAPDFELPSTADRGKTCLSELHGRPVVLVFYPGDLSGVRSGVNGTPTFFINGLRHEGEWDYESLLDALRTAVSARA